MIPWGSLIQVAMTLLGMFIQKKTNDKEAVELHKRLAQRLREQGLKSVRSRFESDDQLAAGDAEWDRIEKEKTDGKV